MGEQTLKKNDLPAGWEHTILKDVCEIVLGQSPPSETYNTDGIGLPFFQGKAEFTTLNPIAAKWCSIPGKIAEQNDILLSVRAPVGDTNIADRRCCIGRGLAALRFNHYKFLFYYMRSIEKELDKKGTGSTFKAISGEIVRNTNFPLPPLPEQHRIVAKIEELFSELDKGVEALKTAQQQLKVYRQAVLKWAFEGKLTEVWRRQQKDLPTASQLLEQIRPEREKQAKATGKNLNPEVPLTEADLTELSKLPEDWGWVRMGHIAEACLGKMLDANKNKGTPKPYLRNSNVRWGAFDLSDLQEMKFEDGEDERYGVRKGDLIVCEGGEPGRAAIWNDQIPDMKIQKALHRVRFSEFAQSKYVLFFLVYPQSRLWQRYLPVQ
jgi:type I restriction enzyme S subunit